MTPDDLYSLPFGVGVRLTLRGVDDIVALGRFHGLSSERGGPLRVSVIVEWANGSWLPYGQLHVWSVKEIRSIEVMESVT